MKNLKIFIFSVICLFSYCIVFASNEVVIKSITPVYDEESSIIVSNENNNYNVTFNEKDQNIKYKVVIENTTENELKVSNIDLTEISASYLTYEIELVRGITCITTIDSTNYFITQQNHY